MQNESLFNKSAHDYVLPFSILAALIVSFLVKTFLIKITFSIFAFLLTYVLLYVLSSDGITFNLKMRSSFFRNTITSPRLFFIIAVFASIAVLVIPVSTVYINPDSTLLYFTSLPISSIIRVVSAFFLSSIFPGLIIWYCFLKNYDLNLIEKLGLILVLSYCFTVITGLILNSLQVFTNTTLLIVLWLFVSLLTLLRFKRNIVTEKPVDNVLKVNTSLIALTVMTLGLVVLSYLQVLNVAPLNGILGTDTISYMVNANRFISSDVFGWGTYIWGSFFFWVNASLSGIPLQYVYIGMQFYQLVFVSSFYFLVRTIFAGFSGNRKIAIISTGLVFFFAGISSWLMIDQMVTSPNLYEAYMGVGTVSVLKNLFQNVGAPGITSLALSVFTFDFGLVFYAIAFCFNGLFAKKRTLVTYFLPSLLAAAAFFTHNVNMLLIFFISLLLLFFFYAKSRRFTLIILASSAALVILFDPLSKWLATNLILGTLASIALSSLGEKLVTVGAIFILAVTLLFVFHKKGYLSLNFKLSFTLPNFFRKKPTIVIFWVLGFSIFCASIILFFLNSNIVQYTKIWSQTTYIFPWYYIVFRSYGVIFLFALASIPFLYLVRKRALAMILVLFMSILIPIVLSFVLPTMLPPSIIYTRYSSFLLLPLSIFAALAILHSYSLLKKLSRIIVLLLLVVLISSSLLSQVYAREFYYLNGQSQIFSDDTAAAITWLNNNVPAGSVVLPLSDSAERLLSNLGAGVVVAPNFQVWWLEDVLSKARPEVILYSLEKVNVNYIFVNTGDFSALAGAQEGYLESTLLSLPKVFENNAVTIYRVPDFPIYNDSHLVLVNPSSDVDMSSIKAAWSFLISSGEKFAIADDSSLINLKPGYTYIIPRGASIPLTTQQVLSAIENGASVVSLDNNFVSELLNIKPSNQSESILSTSNMSRWTIEQGAQGELLSYKNNDLNFDYVSAENITITNARTGLICRYTPITPLDFQNVLSITFWVKSSVAGNLYLGIMNDLNHYKVWYGKYNSTYTLSEDDLNKWVKVQLEVNAPSASTPVFDPSDVNYVRIGIDALNTTNNNVEFSVGGFQLSKAISGIAFSNGAVFNGTLNNIDETPPPSFGTILADYTLMDGSKIAYLEYARISGGSLFFINPENMYNTYTDMTASVFNYTAKVLCETLNIGGSATEKWVFPLFPSLFEKVSISRFEVKFDLTKVSGLMMWNSNINVIGNCNITSNDLFIANESLNVKKMTVSNNDLNQIFDNVLLYNVSLRAAGSISAMSRNSTLVMGSNGLYSTMIIQSNSACILKLNGASATFQVNRGGNIQNYSLANANITLELDSHVFTVKIKQPSLQINGTINGLAQGIILRSGDWYFQPKKAVEFSGDFTLCVGYSSNIIYSKFTENK